MDQELYWLREILTTLDGMTLPDEATLAEQDAAAYHLNLAKGHLEKLDQLLNPPIPVGSGNDEPPF